MNRLDEDSAQGPLLLLDGMSLAFRAFYALSTDIQTSQGVVTNALHGFASMLATLIKDHRPRALAVAFDLPGGTFRDALTEDYKGGRAETPVEIEHQFDLIRDFCHVWGIPVLGVPGYEADDVLATLATWGRDHHMNTIVVTGDRDSFQLVEDPYVRVLYNRRGVSEYDLYDEAGIFERCGVEPQRYTLLAAMRGDTSDNLPGVPGVGEKTAAKLLASYKDFDEIFSHLDELTPKLRENLAANEALARRNAEVMALVRTVALDVQPESLQLGGWSRSAVDAFFERFEMNAMKRRYESLAREGLLGPGEESPEVAASPPTVRTLTRSQKFPEGDGCVVVAYHGDRLVATSDDGDTAWTGSWQSFVAQVGGRPLAGHGLKRLVRRAATEGIALGPLHDDVELAAFLVDSVSGRYDLASVRADVFGRSVSGSPANLFDEVSDEQLLEELSDVQALVLFFRARLEALDLLFVYREIELPLATVLGRMEAVGVPVDRALLTSIANEFTEEVEHLDGEIQRMAGHSFKVNSPTQLQVVLFEELGLTPVKKIKSGYSTDAGSLEAIASEHAIIPLILRFRELDKLRGTYGAPLIATIGDDNRIHATFHQTVARTGRLSSEAPNLHNIPVRTEEGRRLRHAFVARPGHTLVVADYNQIELRVLAHLSSDPGLLEAFANATDVHRVIAARVFGVTVDEVTHDQRERAKAVSYGLAYGMEAFGLSQRLGIAVPEAKSIMDAYFRTFPTVKNYMQEAVALARTQGYSRTEFGRLRPFPDLATAVGPQRAAAERQAMNAGIQGLAADIFKLALVRLDRVLQDHQLAARLILQVHDEVMVETPDDELQQVEADVTWALQSAATLSVNLDVSVSTGRNWATAKG